MRKIGSLLCLAVAAASVIFAFFASGAKGWFVGIALFRVVEGGNFLGMIGNIFGVLLTVAGFGAAGLFGLGKNDRRALISSGAMIALCAVSMIFTLIGGSFTLGDILIAVPPALILVSLLKSN
ncbi:MAG: hypothetical protein IJZ95_06665 [Oscillospiraceae bacterium]|nr:hypothetical protein [Oscillospiraceae bacterium]